VTRRPSNTTVGVALVTFAVVAATPLWAAPAVTRLMVDVLVVVAATVLWASIASAARVVVIGLHGFAGLGAATLVVLTERADLNPVLAVGGAGVVAAAVALAATPVLLRAAPAVALLASWSLAELLRAIVLQVPALGGRTPRALDAVAELGGASDGIVAWLAVVVGLGAVAAVYAFRRSRLGLALAAERDDEPAARSLGLPVGRARWLIVVIAAAGLAMAGATVRLREGVVDTDVAFGVVRWSLVPLVLASLGGYRSIEGPVLAAVLYVAVARIAGGHDLAVSGFFACAALGVIVAFGPGGLWGLVQRVAPVELFPLRRWFDENAPREAARRR